MTHECIAILKFLSLGFFAVSSEVTAKTQKRQGAKYIFGTVTQAPVAHRVTHENALRRRRLGNQL
jgi:hypothetical protein